MIRLVKTQFGVPRKKEWAMKVILGLTVIAILSSFCTGCSHHDNVRPKPATADKNQVKSRPPAKISCQKKPNVEGMLRTLCY